MRATSAYQSALCFGRAVLGLHVDGHQAELRAVAVGPLEVVEQRPGEVALDRYAVFHGLVHLAEVAGDVLETVGVDDAAVDADRCRALPRRSR